MKSALKISLIYFTFSLLWILFSDKFLFILNKNFETYALNQTIKGIFFISLTSLIIYFLSNFYLNKEKKLTSEIKNIFDNSGTPIALINQKGKSLKINKTWESLLGFKLNNIVSLESFLLKTSLENKNEFKKKFVLLIKEGGKRNLGIYKLKTIDNKFLYWNFSGSLIDKNHIVITALDITELKIKDKILLQQTKMATMGEMIGNIAHQWKQPISVISMANSLNKFNLENEILSQKEKEEHFKESISSIEASVENLSETINDFRNFFNPNKKVTTFKLSKVFQKVLKLIQMQFKHNNIEIIEDIKDIEIESFENELLQVIINIIKNSKDELIKLKNLKNKVIFIKTYSKNNNAYIEILDNAGGIPKENIEKIFKKYFTTKKETENSGIGLYICKEIIDNNIKGEISVKNKTFDYKNNNYTGANFTLSIPLNRISQLEKYGNL